MEITGLGWSGTRTEHAEELAQFYENVLGLRRVHSEPEFWVFELPDGRHVEVFGTRYAGKQYMETGPVVGFAVAELPKAVAELRRAGVEASRRARAELAAIPRPGRQRVRTRLDRLPLGAPRWSMPKTVPMPPRQREVSG